MDKVSEKRRKLVLVAKKVAHKKQFFLRCSQIILERQQQLKNLKGFVVKMKGNKLHDCFLTWTKLASQRAKLRRFLIRFVGGKSTRQLSFAIRLWHSAAEAARRDEDELNNAGVEDLREQVQMLQAELDIATRSMGELHRQKQISGKKNMKKIVGMWR